MILLVALLATSGASLILGDQEINPETDGNASRKVLGSSVVTSVSVILDQGNGTQAYFTDAVGKPVSKPLTASQLASPINLLNPDRYEFYTFDDNGDLVKRLMTLKEIQSIIANADGDFTKLGGPPEKKVDDVVTNVQNVLKEEMAAHDPNAKPILDTPDVSSTWSMILPSIFGHADAAVPFETDESSSTITTPSAVLNSTKIPSTEASIKPELFTFFSLFDTSTNRNKPTTEKLTTVNVVPDKNSVTIIPNSNAQGSEILHGVDDSQLVSIKPTQSTASTTQKPIYITKKPAEASSTTHVNKITRPTSHISTKTSSTTLPTTLQDKLQSTASTQPAVGIEKSSISDISAEQDSTSNIAVTQGTTQKNPAQTTKRSPSTTQHATSTEKIILTTTNHADHSESSTEILKTSASENLRPLTSTVNYRPIIYLLTTPENDPNQFLTTIRTTGTTANDKTTPVTTKPTEVVKTTNRPTKFGTSTKPSSQTTNYTSNTSSKPFTTTKKQTTVSSAVPSTTKTTQRTTTTPTTTSTTTTTTTTTTPKTTTTTSTTTSAPTTTTTTTASTTRETTTIQEVILSDESEENYSENEQDTNGIEKESLSTTEALGDKLSVTELLDQLLQSTDIYEINTQLSEAHKLQTTTNLISDLTESPNALALTDSSSKESTEIPDSKDATEVKNSVDSTTVQEPTTVGTTIPDTTTTVSDKLTTITTLSSEITEQNTIPTEEITTTETGAKINPNVMEQIDEIMKNSTAQVQSQIINDKEVDKVQSMLTQSGAQPMDQFQLQTATIASDLLDNSDVESSTLDKNTPINDVLSTLISQIINSDQTTLSDITTTMTQTDAPTTLDQNTKNNTEDQTEVPHDIHVIIYRTTQAAANSLLSEITTTKTDQQIETTTHNRLKDNIKESTKMQGSSYKLVTDERETNSTKSFESNHSTTSATKDMDFTTVVTDFAEIDSTSTTEAITDFTTKFDLTTLSKLVSTTKVDSSPATTPSLSTEQTENSTLTKHPVASTPMPFSANKNGANNTNSQDNSSWTLVSIVPSNSNISSKPIEDSKPNIPNIHIDPPRPVDLVPQPLQGFGLEDSTSHLDTDIYKFVELCNELAFGFWQSVTNGISSARSVFTSPFSATSLLAMVFLGARGSTSGEMNEILKLDDMVTFNPHLIFRNVTESIDASSGSGIATSAIIRELYSDRSKGKLLSFYKERARQFYDGHVEEVSFKEIADVIRRRTNLLVKRQTFGKIPEYVKDIQVTARPPLAGISAAIFQTDCSAASTEGRDGELYFVVLPTIRQRRLIPVPAVVYRSGFLAGYDPGLDATAVALGSKDQVVSTIFVIPGQQGIAAPGDGLARLEKHLTDTAFKRGSWPRLLRSLIPRPGLEVQIPRFSHRSILNATVALQKMGLKDLFDSKKADLRGLNGVAHELHLSDLLQINTFATCGENSIEDTHHSEIYPATAARPSRQSRNGENIEAILKEPLDYQRAFPDPLHNPTFLALPLSLRPRQARLPEVPRLRFDRPFLYFVRHNPTGLILHMGRFNPRLLP